FVSPFPESSITPISDNNNLDINNDIINESELYNENSALETDDISTTSPVQGQTISPPVFWDCLTSLHISNMKDFVSPFPESSITPISDNNNLDINNDIINESELYNENSALETDDIST
ncbi:21304_t:CDS:2, partial [Entrophospora sp. SA101]